MEQNLYKALQNPPTLSELAVLVLYAQSVTHPYMHVVHAPGIKTTNLLSLGPLHVRLKAHIRMLQDNPSVILGPNASYLYGSFDSLAWENPLAVETVLRMAPDLPYLEPLLVTFLQGAADTWECFTSEFAVDGLIDLASDAE